MNSSNVCMRMKQLPYPRSVYFQFLGYGRQHSRKILKIFITAGCHGCKRALELAEWIRKAKPRLAVQIIELAEEPYARLGMVVAVPT